ncbi:uncharacterized protein Z520_10505 [Fonsecaea multimorphosa CBS 102226]|uniref:Uncharacterized protein n=1 Tax=Fonsecaea multimorphosa CBS 102226 TaxID=1442371 RepID=A0A0D2GWA7_9EURO|nr:uncharacterized protein Z520_10505 [Fonsecaea multimorphosa CBS 102226]KIX93880.1 hypothetical protein Z520_10505 [Fonsecaea multimorphosa CBS 102226]OAL19117.1 hypothetical protein AYO22_10065 [Fonsecaea multimorphosa]
MVTNSALPTLPGGFNYPPPTVPPKAGAPYLASSKLPENFVFIVVGAVLGFVAVLIIGWRILMSWSINRSFRRDASSGAGSGVAYTPLADIKKNPAIQSSHDMADLSKLPRSFSSVPSLFFSPTAEVAKQSQRPTSSQNTHLPAGHYRDASDSYRR